MDSNLLHKYFQGQCTEEELEEVFDWLQTDEGQRYLEQDIYQLNEEPMEERQLVYPEVDTEKIFNRIQLRKRQAYNKNRRWGLRVASILLLVTALSALWYWVGITAISESEEPAYATYVTQPNQQKVLTLSEGTRIRLNEGATLVVPDKLTDGKREVALQGEAYFEVAHDQAHPFMVQTAGSVVEVLGTTFNVKADSVANNVQVAVLEGKVALKSGAGEDLASAVLTRNNIGILQLSDSQITIEEMNTENFISWIHNRLVFSGETLQQVSRQLERLYNVDITFASEELKHLELTADMAKIDLDEVLATISDTFDIRYRMEDNRVVWLE